MKEDCENDPGWCFKAAVNTSLPATFFSYGQASTGSSWQIQALATAIANMTVPSSSDILAIPLGIAGAVPGLSSSSRRNFLRSRLQHRFEAVHLRRDYNASGTELAPNQRSITKGYSDGFLTAKSFASFNTSKLGFIGQFIMDSIAQLGPSVIAPGTESNYHDGFVRGLEDGQRIVMEAVNPSR